MINELRIANLGVIDEASLELDPGLTVVTGETGAGKTMIVTGLGLLLGQRADPGAIRKGATRARVEGVFTGLPEPVLGQVGELGGDVDGDPAELIITRQVAASRSRSFVGGAGVPLSACAEVAEHLITIHGQSEQVRLGQTDRQREILDRFAGAALTKVLGTYARDYRARREAAAELRELTEQAQQRAREIDLLQFGLAEIEKIDPQPGEDVELAAEANRLQASDELRSDAEAALAALAGSEDDIDAAAAMTGVSLARKALHSAAEADPAAKGLAERADEVSFLLGDLSTEVASYLADVQADPSRLEAIAARRADLQGLTRKYGDTVDEVLAWAGESAARLTGLNSSDDRIVTLQGKLTTLDAAIADGAGKLTKLRKKAATTLAKQVRIELKALAMPHARLEFEIAGLDEPGPHGADQITLQFTANPGSELRPLAKAASGGELSRIRLALEVVLAADGDTATYVFDEVDAGVGGKVAVEIGRRLARLAEHSQVIVVTHLAQVAAFADRHHVVVKASDGQVTTSGVREVDDDERASELARMMAGLEATESAMEHARELLATARG